jgi:NAD+ synthase
MSEDTGLERIVEQLTDEIPHLVEWVKNYVHYAGAQGVVVGLSGGIDSAVVSALGVQALGKDKVLGVILPCESDPQDEADAKLVANWLGIGYHVVDLADPYGHFANRIAALADAGILTRANIKARLRMTTLYAFANQHNYLNMGTGNQSELWIGYITKYGDGGVDFEPIGQFFKTEVYEIAKILGVPGRVIERAPTAGLWEGQTDEDEIGMTYEQLDECLKIRCGAMMPKHVSVDMERRYKKVMKMVDKSGHKRKMPPSYNREIR